MAVFDLPSQLQEQEHVLCSISAAVKH